MTTVQELREAAASLDDALRRWEASGYSDDVTLQEAVVYHTRLAPVLLRIYGTIPLLVTQYPPYIIMRRERDHLVQVIGALEGGLITQAYLDGLTAAELDTPAEQTNDEATGPRSPLDNLIEEGGSFSYATFARRGKYGFPNELSLEWASWAARVESAVLPVLRSGSTQHSALVEGLSWPYLGNDEESFLRGRSLILGAIAAARDLVNSEQLGLPSPNPVSPISERVFVVHGHDDLAKSGVEQFLVEQGLVPVVLHRQPDQGMTVIEKFEQYADVGFAIVLLTPDDIAFPATTDDLNRDSGAIRARPNVLFEFGYFVGRLGRDRVCCLYTGEVEMPSDLAGLLYKQYAKAPNEVFYELLKELRAAGYEV